MPRSKRYLMSRSRDRVNLLEVINVPLDALLVLAPRQSEYSGFGLSNEPPTELTGNLGTVLRRVTLFLCRRYTTIVETSD